MNVHQLRRWSDQAGNGLKSTGEAAKSGANAVYSRVMNNPKTATAVVLGTGVAAALLWLANHNGASRRTQARVRATPKRSRRARAAS